MTEEFIMSYIPHRIQELGFGSYHIRYRDFYVQAEGSTTIQAFNELYFIIGTPEDVRVDSDYGMYDSTGTYIAENTHQHKGIITITNTTDETQRIEFIQVIIIK